LVITFLSQIIPSIKYNYCSTIKFKQNENSKNCKSIFYFILLLSGYEDSLIIQKITDENDATTEAALEGIGTTHTQGVAYWNGYYYISRNRNNSYDNQKFVIINERSSRVVTTLDLYGASTHPGGIQIYNGILAVPFDYVNHLDLYDLNSDPLNPQFKKRIYQSGGICAGITEYNNHYLEGKKAKHISVSLNNNGYCVATYIVGGKDFYCRGGSSSSATHRGNRYYRKGAVNFLTGDIAWGNSILYDTGGDGDIAINNNGKGILAFVASGRLYYRIAF